MKSCRSQWWATSACLLWLVQHVAILRVVRKSLWTTLDAFHDFVKIMFDNFDNATKNSCLLHVVKLLHFYLDPFHTRSMHGHPASLHAPSHLGQKDCSISMHIILLNIIKSHIVTWKLESNWHRKNDDRSRTIWGHAPQHKLRLPNVSKPGRWRRKRWPGRVNYICWPAKDWNYQKWE